MIKSFQATHLFLAKTGTRNHAYSLKIPSLVRFSDSHVHNFALRDLFCPSLESIETAVIKIRSDLYSMIKSFQVTHFFLAKTGPKNHAYSLKIPSFARFSESHGHNFAFKDMLCPSLESWEPAVINTGADFDFTIKSFQVTHFFLAKTGTRNHAYSLKIPPFSCISDSHGHNFALRDMFCPSLES